MKVCLVGSSGGHLTHLYMLKPFWADKNRFWVTFDKEDTRSLLEGEQVYPCYFPTNRNIKNLIRNTTLAWKVLRKEKPDLIVSSGAAVVVPFFYLGKLFFMRVSIICVYNNELQMNSQLKTSLANQDMEHEFIGINNTSGSFSSAAGALNHGAAIASGDILIFSHQDIFLKTEDTLRVLAEAIARCETGTIIGTAGVKEPSKKYYENLTSGVDYDPTLQSCCGNRLFEVSCVDEGLFGMTRATWEAHPFDEELCDNWHLYAVEACLWAREHGHCVYVFPVQIHHFSKGRISRSYMRGFVRLADRYRKSHRYIWTTCYKAPSSWLYVRLLYAAWVANRVVRGRALD